MKTTVKSTGKADKKTLNMSFANVGKVRSYILENSADLQNKNVSRILRESKKVQSLYELINAYTYRGKNGLISFSVLYDVCANLAETIEQDFEQSAKTHFTKVVNSKIETVKTRLSKLEAEKLVCAPEKLANFEASILSAKNEINRLESLLVK